MATTNIWQQFKALIPEGTRTVVIIIANNGNGNGNGNGTSQAQLRDGSRVTVKGGAVGIGQKAFVQGGEVKGIALELVQYEAEV